MEISEYQSMAELQDRHWWFEAKRRIARALLSRYGNPTMPAATVAAGESGAASDVVPPRVLDVGCGTGAMSPVLREHGRLFATDAYVPALRVVAEREPPEARTAMIAADLLGLPFGSGSFALIGCFDVLYHRGVPAVPDALRELFRVCAPGDSLVITDSAFEVLRSSHDVATHAARRFRLPELRHELEAAGFSVIHTTYYHTLLFPAALALRFAKRLIHGAPTLGSDEAANDVPPRSDLAPVAGWLNSSLSALYRIEAPLATRLRMPFGSSVVALARRPAARKPRLTSVAKSGAGLVG